MPDSDESLLRFLYQVPVSVVQIDNDGGIGMINPNAAQVLMPLSRDGSLLNVFSVLEPWLPDLHTEFTAHAEPGPVFTNRTLLIPGEYRQHLSVTLNRLDAETGVVVIQDISEREQIREQLETERKQAEFLKGRQEAVSGVLHDIGNAVTSVSVHAAELFRDDPWNEVGLLDKTRDLLQSETLRPHLDSGLGKEKAAALPELLKEIIQQLNSRRESMQTHITRLNQGLHHIEEILVVQQRQTRYGHTQHGKFMLQDLVQDSISMIQSQLNRRGILLQQDLQTSLGPLTGDPTRMTRVILNLLRNAVDSFDRMKPPADEPRLTIRIDPGNAEQILTISDNAGGFQPEEAELFFQSGVSSKDQPSGIGLCSCRKIVQDEGGSLLLSSEGPGQGATATLSLPETAHPTPQPEE